MNREKVFLAIFSIIWTMASTGALFYNAINGGSVSLFVAGVCILFACMSFYMYDN